MRRAGRLQDQVARDLQLVGQGRLALQHPARGAQIGRVIGRRDDALGVGALQRGHAQQQGGHGLGAVTAVQQGVAGRAVQHVQQGTTGAPGGAQQRLVHAVGGLRRHGQQHGEHDGGGHRHATPTPGGGEKRQEGATHQQQPQLDRVSAQQLHRQEQRQAQQRRGDQMGQLAPLRPRCVGDQGDDGADADVDGGGRAKGGVAQQRGQAHADGHGQTAQDVGAQQGAPRVPESLLQVSGHGAMRWRLPAGAGAAVRASPAPRSGARSAPARPGHPRVSIPAAGCRRPPGLARRRRSSSLPAEPCGCPAGG